MLHQAKAAEEALQSTLRYLCKLESDNPIGGANDINFIKNELECFHLVRYRGAVVVADLVSCVFQ